MDRIAPIQIKYNTRKLKRYCFENSIIYSSTSNKIDTVYFLAVWKHNHIASKKLEAAITTEYLSTNSLMYLVQNWGLEGPEMHLDFNVLLLVYKWQHKVPSLIMTPLKEMFSFFFVSEVIPYISSIWGSVAISVNEGLLLSTRKMNGKRADCTIE